MNGERKFDWRPLLGGAVLGLILGLVYAWFANPVNYVNITPRQLKADNREDYIVLISQAYLYDLNLDRARQRLATLGFQNAQAAVTRLADDAFTRGASPEHIRALTVLAEALGGQPQAAEIFSGTSVAVNAAKSTATPTFEAVASPTASATPLPPPPTIPQPTETPVLIPSNATMKLVAIQTLCKADYPAGRLEVYVLDVSGGGIPAVKVQVTWEGKTDTFFTGLKPEVSPGYADFQMDARKTYTVTLVGLTEPVLGISSALCKTDSGASQIPSYQLTFAPVTN